jgi:hypothetical protein
MFDSNEGMSTGHPGYWVFVQKINYWNIQYLQAYIRRHPAISVPWLAIAAVKPRPMSYAQTVLKSERFSGLFSGDSGPNSISSVGLAGVKSIKPPRERLMPQSGPSR